MALYKVASLWLLPRQRVVRTLVCVQMESTYEEFATTANKQKRRRQDTANLKHVKQPGGTRRHTTIDRFHTMHGHTHTRQR